MVQKPLKTHGAQPFDGLLVGVILQTRERGLRGQKIGFTNDGLKRGIAAQCISVVAVLVACADLINSLTPISWVWCSMNNGLRQSLKSPVSFFVSASCASNWRNSKRPESLVISPPLKSRTIFG